MQADVSAQAHGGHGLGFGEHFGVRPQTHFHVLRPGIAALQFGFELQRPLGTRLNFRQIGADQFVDHAAHLGGLRGIAASLLLDHPLQQAHGERDATGLDGLNVAGRQQLQSQLPGKQRVDRAQGLARRRTNHVHGVAAFEQIGRGGRKARDVEHLATAHDDDRWAVDRCRPPYAPDQQGTIQVLGQAEGKGWVHFQNSSCVESWRRSHITAPICHGTNSLWP